MLRNRERDLLTAFKDRGIFRQTESTGHHYLLFNGNHTNEFFHFAKEFADADFRRNIGIEFMEELGKYGLDHDIDVIVTPAMGGVLMCGTMQHLFYGRKPLLFYAEKEDGALKFRRGFCLAEGQRVLIVDDVYTSGKSFAMLKILCDENEALVVAMGAIVNRNSEGRPLSEDTITIPHIFLLRHPIQEISREKCGDCKSGIPLEKDGVLVDADGNIVKSEQTVDDF